MKNKTTFEAFLEQQANFELASKINDLEKTPLPSQYLQATQSQVKILVASALNLDWQGDFLANPNYQWELQDIPLDKCMLSGASAKWNEVFARCKKDIGAFKEILAKESDTRAIFEQEASYDERHPIVMRYDEHTQTYRSINGIHRLVGHILQGSEAVSAWVCINESTEKPICMPSTVYDILRGYQRGSRSESEKQELIGALKLLQKSYSNVKPLLQNRFDMLHIPDEDLQQLITQSLQ